MTQPAPTQAEIDRINQAILAEGERLGLPVETITFTPIEPSDLPGLPSFTQTPDQD